MIDRVEGAVSIRILERERLATEVETTLGSEDSADLKLPRQLQQAVDLEGVLDGQIRWSFIQIWSVHKRPGGRDKSSVGANKGAVLVGVAGSSFRHQRGDADEAIRRQAGDAELIVSFVSEGVITAQDKAATE